MDTMKLLDKLEKKLGRFAVPNLTAILVVCQVLAYVLQYANPSLLNSMALVPKDVLRGEVWRLVTFLFEPPLSNPLFAFFFWYLFYLMGTALEGSWGNFRYNLYLLVGYVATVAVSFFTPEAPASIGFLQVSVFLAFAFLFPDFQILLFFLLPVKIKWLALLTWIGYLYVLAVGQPMQQLGVLATICNFLLFFGRDIYLRMRSGRRRMGDQAERIKSRRKPFHRCRVCGATDLSHPDMEFRYCSKCAGGCCYCTEHLRNHEHVVTEDAAKK